MGSSVGGVKEQFLQGASVVLSAVSDPRVAAAWDEASVLEGQTVGGLAGHLARGGVWVVGDYLDGELPSTAVDFETATDYYAEVARTLTAADHVAIRARGATVAAAGPVAIAEQLATRLDALRTRLPAEPPERVLAVFAGNVMPLDEYLVTRIVEQVVHLDDLARSIDAEPWPDPPGAADVVIACGTAVGRRNSGDTAMVRALFRGDTTGVLPVL